MPSRITPLKISAYTATSAVGVGKAPLLAALESSRSGLRANDFVDEVPGRAALVPLPTWIGRVAGLEEMRLPEALASWDCRNNRLAWLGLDTDGFVEAVAAAREKYGASRIAVILGTSTSSIGETESAYAHLDAEGGFPADQRRPLVHTPHSLAMFVQAALGLEGPNETISTACSSSAKAFASAERLIRLGLVDAAVVGGVDTLCGSVLYGFNSLELVSPQPCRPFDAARDGISLGEGAGFALVERASSDGASEGASEGAAAASQLYLLGYGEASDAHHMSTPHPQGLGAERALDDALARAGLAPEAIGYINMHGTASTKNDEVEGALVARRFPETVHASSTKGFTGHTLGAAGIVEAAISLLALESGLLPGTINTTVLDSDCGPQIKMAPARADVRYALSNSFGFGGNNCSLIFGKGAQA